MTAAVGGGGGGYYTGTGSPTTGTAGSSGGSGGGAGFDASSGTVAGGAATAGQGHTGGSITNGGSFASDPGGGVEDLALSAGMPPPITVGPEGTELRTQSRGVPLLMRAVAAGGWAAEELRASADRAAAGNGGGKCRRK